MKDELGPDIAEEAFDLSRVGEVAFLARWRERLLTLLVKPGDDMRAQEAVAARHENPHRTATGRRCESSQSTRPIQRSRFAAYQAIVWRMPSSHDTRGIHPVSRFSLS